MDVLEENEIIESVEDFVRKSTASKKSTTAKKATTTAKKATTTAKKATTTAKKGPLPAVAPPVVKAEVGKVVAYHADQNQPIPSPKQITVIATFNPVFITAQNKPLPQPFSTAAPESSTVPPSTGPPETTPFPMEMTVSPSPIVSVMADQLQYVTYAPAEMPTV